MVGLVEELKPNIGRWRTEMGRRRYGRSRTAAAAAAAGATATTTAATVGNGWMGNGMELKPTRSTPRRACLALIAGKMRLVRWGEICRHKGQGGARHTILKLALCFFMSWLSESYDRYDNCYLYLVSYPAYGVEIARSSDVFAALCFGRLRSSQYNTSQHMTSCTSI